MWSFQKLLFTFCIVLDSDIGVAQLIDVSGYEGRDMKISCPYDNGYDSYEKYFCRNDCGNDDILITTAEAQKNRYSITDDTNVNVFTVTISQLAAADAGKYWCGISKSFRDIYTEVKLNVKPDSCCDDVTIIKSFPGNSLSISCPYRPEFLNNLKYICGGRQPSVCLQRAVVTSDKQLNGRFRLQDDNASRHFTVTVTDVTKDDAGSYLCGVHRNNHLDNFYHIQVEVKDWCCVKSQEVSESVGHPVTLQCPYPPQHVSNRKFFCKGERRTSCRNMVESQSQADLRFTLQDNAASSSFSVTIVKLEASDTGTYWCGSDSEWRPGNYTKIQLSVVPTQTERLPPMTTVETTVTPTHDSDAALYYGMAVIGVVLLLMLMLALIMFIKWKCKAQGAENSTMTKHVKEAMSMSDIYGNQEVVVNTKLRSSKPQNLRQHRNAQQETVYQNFEPEDTYCNQYYHKDNKR